MLEGCQPVTGTLMGTGSGNDFSVSKTCPLWQKQKNSGALWVGIQLPARKGGCCPQKEGSDRFPAQAVDVSCGVLKLHMFLGHIHSLKTGGWHMCLWVVLVLQLHIYV